MKKWIFMLLVGIGFLTATASDAGSVIKKSEHIIIQSDCAHSDISINFDFQIFVIFENPEKEFFNQEFENGSILIGDTEGAKNLRLLRPGIRFLSLSFSKHNLMANRTIYMEKSILIKPHPRLC